MSRKRRKATELAATSDYDDVLTGVVDLLEAARRTSARAVNAVMTAAYWEIGRRIVECEQRGSERAEYGEQLTKRLAIDLTQRFGRGFGHVNLSLMRRFYLRWPPEQIFQTLSEKSLGDAERRTSDPRIAQTPSAQSGQSLSADSAESASPPILQTLSTKFDFPTIARRFPLPWSHDVRLLNVEKAQARRFYETEALRGGWSVRQLDRQISTLFYERTLASRNKRAMLKKGSVPRAGETPTAEECIQRTGHIAHIVG